MRKVLELVHRGITWLVAAGFLAIFLIYVIQIVNRYLFGDTWLWAPDLARLLFVWMVFLGATALYHQKGHLAVEFLLHRMPARRRSLAELASELMSAGFFLLLAVKGWEIALRRMRVPFDTWDLPTGYAYAAAPVCAFIMLAVTLDRLFDRLRPPKPEEKP